MGWERIGQVALSPVVTDAEVLPAAGYDEWYVVHRWPAGEQPHVFINYGAFSLRDPAHLTKGFDPTWDRAGSEHLRDMVAERLERFWDQMERIDPLAYLAEGDRLLCVTRDPVLFSRCERWFRSQP